VVDLSWTADAALGYRIEVGRGPALHDAAIFTTGVTTTFTVQGLSPGTYYIRVRAFNAAGESAPSNEAVATLFAPGTQGAPRNMRVSVAGRAVQLLWLPPDGSIAISGYQLEVGSAPGASDLMIAMVPTLSIAANGVADGTYFVRVRALSAAGLGPASNEVQVVVGRSPACAAAPSAPMHLTSTVTGNLVQLSWLPPATGATGASYTVVVGASAGQSNLAAFPVGGVTTMTAPAPNGRFFVRVVAINACGASAGSNEVVVSVGVSDAAVAIPDAPAHPRAHAVGREVTLSWNEPATGHVTDRYIIQVNDAAGNPIITVDTGNAATTFSQSAVPAGVYRIRVAGANAAGMGAFSPPVTVVVRD
jgi:predicted phage tail protein